MRSVGRLVRGAKNCVEDGLADDAGLRLKQCGFLGRHPDSSPGKPKILRHVYYLINQTLRSRIWLRGRESVLVQTKCFKNRILCVSTSHVLRVKTLNAVMPSG